MKFFTVFGNKEGLEIVREIIDTYKSDDLLYEVGMDDVCIVVDWDSIVSPLINMMRLC